MSKRRLIVPQRFRRAAGRRGCYVRACGVILTIAMTLPSVPVIAAEVCKPVLNIVNSHLSDVTPSMERKWTATVTADASRCATTAGYFELGILREKEESPDLAFREEFVWSAPSVLIGLDFWRDEAVGEYWIYSIQPCPCAK
jgi:hypothetical protein